MAIHLISIPISKCMLNRAAKINTSDLHYLTFAHVCIELLDPVFHFGFHLELFLKVTTRRNATEVSIYFVTKSAGSYTVAKWVLHLASNHGQPRTAQVGQPNRNWKLPSFQGGDGNVGYMRPREQHYILYLTFIFQRLFLDFIRRQ